MIEQQCIVCNQGTLHVFHCFAIGKDGWVMAKKNRLWKSPSRATEIMKERALPPGFSSSGCVFFLDTTTRNHPIFYVPGLVHVLKVRGDDKAKMR